MAEKVHISCDANRALRLRSQGKTKSIAFFIGLRSLRTYNVLFSGVTIFSRGSLYYTLATHPLARLQCGMH